MLNEVICKFNWLIENVVRKETPWHWFVDQGLSEPDVMRHLHTGLWIRDCWSHMPRDTVTPDYGSGIVRATCHKTPWHRIMDQGLSEPDVMRHLDTGLWIRDCQSHMPWDTVTPDCGSGIVRARCHETPWHRIMDQGLFRHTASINSTPAWV